MASERARATSTQKRPERGCEPVFCVPDFKNPGVLFCTVPPTTLIAACPWMLAWHALSRYICNKALCEMTCTTHKAQNPEHNQKHIEQLPNESLRCLQETQLCAHQ